MFSFPPCALDTSPLPASESDDPVPPLLLVSMTLFAALQTEEPGLRSVCLESLFKVASYCPAGSPLREVIEAELHCLAAETFAISSQDHIVDPRSPPSLLASMNLSSALQETESSSGGGSGSGSASLSGARWLGTSPSSQTSGKCQEVLLYSLALESMKAFNDDTFPKP